MDFACSHIPESIWLEICKFLTAKDLCKLSLASKKLNEIASSNYAWCHIISKNNRNISSIINFKKYYAETNFVAIKMINKHCVDMANLEKAMERERKRQISLLKKKHAARSYALGPGLNS